MEEERRLCYVGVTRARERLYMTTCRSRMIFGDRRSFTSSRFLAEMPGEDIEKQGLVARDDWSSAFRERRVSSNPTNLGPSTFGNTGEFRTVVPQSFGADLSLSYEPGDAVEHRKWGRGEIVSASGSGETLELLVRFLDPIGERKLFAKFAPITKITEDS